MVAYIRRDGVRLGTVGRPVGWENCKRRCYIAFEGSLVVNLTWRFVESFAGDRLDVVAGLGRRLIWPCSSVICASDHRSGMRGCLRGELQSPGDVAELDPGRNQMQ